MDMLSAERRLAMILRTLQNVAVQIGLVPPQTTVDIERMLSEIPWRATARDGVRPLAEAALQAATRLPDLAQQMNETMQRVRDEHVSLTREVEELRKFRQQVQQLVCPDANTSPFPDASSVRSLDRAMYDCLCRMFENRDDAFWALTFNDEGESRLGVGYSGVCCTGYAATVYKHLRGIGVEIYGVVPREDVARPIIIEDCDGHDFALVHGRFIVDPWLTEVCGGTMGSRQYGAVNYIDHPLTIELYGRREHWVRMEKVEAMVDKMLQT